MTNSKNQALPTELETILAKIETLKTADVPDVEQITTLSHQALAILSTMTDEGVEIARASIHHFLGITLLTQNVEQAIYHHQQALIAYTPQNSAKQWAYVQMGLGDAYLYRTEGDKAENIEQSIKSYQHSLEFMTQANAPIQWAKILLNLAYAYTQRLQGTYIENIKHALNYHQQTLQVYTLKNHPLEWTATQTAQAALWLKLAKFDPEYAIPHLLESAQSAEQAVALIEGLDKPTSAKIRYQIAQVYRLVGYKEQASHLLEEARQIFSDHHNTLSLARTLLEIALLAHQNKRLTKAEDYLKQSLELFTELDYTEGIATTQESLGHLAIQTNKPVQAKKYLQAAREKYALLDHTERVEGIDKVLGEIERRT